MRIVLFSLAALTFAAPHAAALDFFQETPRFYAAPDGTGPVAVSDLDSDGRPEVVAISSDRVALWTTNPDGLLIPRSDRAPGFTPLDLAVGDFNGDGRPDLAISSWLQSRVAICAGKGNLEFEEPVWHSTPQRSNLLRVADFDADGRDDLAVSFYHPATGAGSECFSVFFGRPSLPLDRADHGTTRIFGRHISVGDFDGDGRTDLALSSGSGLEYYFNDGGRRFSNPVFRTAPAITSYDAGDIDGDGIDDIAILGGPSFWRKNAYLLRGVAGRQPPEASLIEPEIEFAGDVCRLVDFDVDGVPDLLTTGHACRISWGVGNGTFSTRTIAGLDWNWTFVAFADLNGDNLPDIVGAGDRRAPGRIGVILSSGLRRFTFDASWRTPPRTVDVVPLRRVNAIGSDLAVVDSDGIVSILHSDGYGTFRGADSTLGTGPLGAAAPADFDADGTDELAVLDTGARVLRTFAATPSGWKEIEALPAGNDPRDVAIADLDGDGALDVVVSDAHSRQLLAWRSAAPGQATSAWSVPTSHPPDELHLADLDGDGRCEAVANSVDRRAVTVFSDLGPEGWRSQGTLLTQDATSGISTADVDRDGRREVLTIMPERTVLVVLGLGTEGVLVPIHEYPLLQRPGQFSVGDFDRDAIDDVAVASPSDSTVTVHLGDGTGSFGLETTARLIGPPSMLRSIEIDGDRWPDLVWCDVAGGWGRSLWNVYRAVPVSELHVTATRTGARIEISWEAGEDATGSTFAIWRATPDGNRAIVVDRVMGGPYVWRVVLAEEPPELQVYWLSEVDRHGRRIWHGPIEVGGESDPPAMASAMRVWPNPSRGAVTISLTLPAAGRVRMDVVDVSGRQLVALMDESRPQGLLSATWDGRTAGGALVPAGVYFLRTRMDNSLWVRRIVRSR